MKITETKMVHHTNTIVKAIKCDYCSVEYDDVNEMQEFICIKTTGGYGSVIGDCTDVELDLCQRCFKKLFEKFYRTKEMQ